MMLLFLILCPALTFAATTYYVATAANGGSDANDGSIGSPWLTVQYAMDTVVGGDTIIVGVGTFTGRITTTKGGSAGNYITVTGASQAGTIIVAGPNLGEDKGWRITHDYIKIQNMTIRGDGLGSYAQIFYLDGADYVEISGNIVEYSLSVSPLLDVGGFALTSTSTHCTIQNNTIRYIHYLDFAINGSSHLIEGNTVIGRNYQGDTSPSIDGGDMDFIALSGNGTTIRSNDFSGKQLGYRDHLDFVAYATGMGATSLNHIIERNFIHDINGGMQPLTVNVNDAEYAANPGNFGNWTFRNNIWANLANNGNGNVDLPNMKFYNETFYKVAQSFPLFFLDGATGYSHGTGGVVKNCIFIDCGDQVTSGWYAQSAGNDLDADYNYVAQGPGASYAAKTGFATGSPETNGIGGGNPYLSNIGGSSALDYALTSSSTILINEGADLSGSFTDDYAGVVRPQGSAYDMGAYEDPAPTITSFTVDPSGAFVTIHGSENLAVTTGAGYTLSSDGDAVTLTHTSISGTDIIQATSRTILSTENLTYSYTGTDTKDLSGNDLAAITDEVVTNSSTQSGAVTAQTTHGVTGSTVHAGSGSTIYQ